MSTVCLYHAPIYDIVQEWPGASGPSSGFR